MTIFITANKLFVLGFVFVYHFIKFKAFYPVDQLQSPLKFMSQYFGTPHTIVILLLDSCTNKMCCPKIHMVTTKRQTTISKYYCGHHLCKDNDTKNTETAQMVYFDFTSRYLFLCTQLTSTKLRSSRSNRFSLFFYFSENWAVCCSTSTTSIT